MMRGRLVKWREGEDMALCSCQSGEDVIRFIIGKVKRKKMKWMSLFNLVMEVAYRKSKVEVGC